MDAASSQRVLKNGTVQCPGIVVACIYKAWFRCYDNHPNIDFGQFFAHPYEITPTGPQTVPDILKTHIHIYDKAELQWEAINRGEVEDLPVEAGKWPRYRLLPLGRAIIVLLDELPPPPVKRPDGTISLDDEIKRMSAVLVLTGLDQGLINPVSFDSIRSKALPLNRNDIGTMDGKEIIRVSLEIAVKFITGLQQDEDRLYPGSRQGANAEMKADDGLAADDSADEFVDKVIDSPPADKSKQFWISQALENIERRERGEVVPEVELRHWRGIWV